jgi:hypothetical protein
MNAEGRALARGYSKVQTKDSHTAAIKIYFAGHHAHFAKRSRALRFVVWLRERSSHPCGSSDNNVAYFALTVKLSKKHLSTVSRPIVDRSVAAIAASNPGGSR